VTPLHLAVTGSSRELVQLLIRHGAEVNVRDSEDRTPLHFAVLYASDLDLIRLLLEAKADPNAADASGATPLRMSDYDHMPWRRGLSRGAITPEAIAALLRQHGARDLAE
jgi:hypothetical protein